MTPSNKQRLRMKGSAEDKERERKSEDNLRALRKECKGQEALQRRLVRSLRRNYADNSAIQRVIAILQGRAPEDIEDPDEGADDSAPTPSRQTRAATVTSTAPPVKGKGRKAEADDGESESGGLLLWLLWLLPSEAPTDH